MNNSQLTKRIFILAGYLVLLSFIGFMLYYWLTPDATCFDNKKNQGEKGLDCGGPCSPCKADFSGQNLIVAEKSFVPGGNNTYDAAIKISNPNNSVGASSFHYVIKLLDDSGAVISTKEGDDYILPADSKFIAQLGLTVSGNNPPSKIDFAITSVKWDQINTTEKPQLNVYNRKFGPDAAGIGSEAEGLVRNESSNDFKKIKIIVILRDEKGNILGVNTTVKDNIRAKEERDFTLTWPYAFNSGVRSMEVDVQTNVFDPENFSASIR